MQKLKSKMNPVLSALSVLVVANTLLFSSISQAAYTPITNVIWVNPPGLPNYQEPGQWPNATQALLLNALALSLSSKKSNNFSSNPSKNPNCATSEGTAVAACTITLNCHLDNGVKNCYKPTSPGTTARYGVVMSIYPIAKANFPQSIPTSATMAWYVTLACSTNLKNNGCSAMTPSLPTWGENPLIAYTTQEVNGVTDNPGGAMSFRKWRRW